MPYTQSQIRCLQGMGIVPWVSRDLVNGESTNPPVSIDASSDASDHASDYASEVAVAQIMREAAGHDDNSVTASATVAAPVPSTPSVVKQVAAEQVVPDQALKAQPEAGLTPHSSALDFMQTPLVEIPFRGQRCAQLGKSDAPLLILVEAISTQQKQYPFEANDAKLFDDMLRSIAWRRQDVCLAVLPPAGNSLLLEDAGDLSANNSADNAAVPCVADLCKPHRDAVLLFRMSLPETLNTDELVVPMERKSMMAWQLPHPAMLRESPNRKRQAWNVLKAVRQRLHPIG